MSKSEFLKEHRRSGEKYGGLMIGDRDYHMFIMRGFQSSLLVRSDDELPTSRELAVLIANIPEHFFRGWYWTSTKCDDANFAFLRHGETGNQHYSPCENEFPVVTIRRVYL